MFISRIVLNPGNRQVASEMARPYEMHRTLLRAFGDGIAPNEEGRILFRLELPRSGWPHVLVVSPWRPHWERLPARYAMEPPECVEYDPVVARGALYHFRLRTRPAVKKSEFGQRQGRRIALLSPEEREGWLRRKGERHGFRVAFVESKEQSWVDSKNGTEQRMPCVLFDGVLEAVEPEAVRQALFRGIGPQKAYGFGLLTVRSG